MTKPDLLSRLDTAIRNRLYSSALLREARDEIKMLREYRTTIQAGGPASAIGGDDALWMLKRHQEAKKLYEMPPADHAAIIDNLLFRHFRPIAQDGGSLAGGGGGNSISKKTI